MVRSNDPPEIQKLLSQYDSCQSFQKMLLLMGLSQLPTEESLAPLMRIVMHEKDPSAARFSALAVLWDLPYTQSVPQFSIPVPEPKLFPDPKEWSARNELNRKKRQETIEKLREYLASEPSGLEGKRFLERLLQLEKSAQEENVDLAPFEGLFQSLSEKVNMEDPVDLTFLHEYLLFSVDLLAQNGHEKEAKDFFISLMSLGQTTFGKSRFHLANERSTTLNYRTFLIQRLVRRGHWDLVPQEIALLNKDISDTEKVRLLSTFSSALSTIGEFDLAREYTQNVRRLNFLRIHKTTEEEAEDATSLRLNQQIAQLQALDACKKEDYAKAKEILIKNFEAKGEPDVDLLILARKIAIFTKDSEWLDDLEKRIDEMLDQTEKSIRSETVKLLGGNQMNTYAWLAANTERKLDEALEYSEEAVRRLPNSPGIQDTLATVYFARGDYEKAFEIQSKAVEESAAEMELWVNLERFRVYRDEKKSEKVETTP
jgi:tetratricopeptide (TPR) repeat protein